MKRILTGVEESAAINYMNVAKEFGYNSSCIRSKCGSVIVNNRIVIGQGFNSPPGNIPLESCRKDILPKDFKSDKTCCIHAEQRAIMDALARNPDKIKGSTIYFIRIDQNGDICFAGQPYCTICSKMALDAGIKEFVLWHKEGITAYDANYYNELSFQYRE